MSCTITKQSIKNHLPTLTPKGRRVFWSILGLIGLLDLVRLWLDFMHFAWVNTAIVLITGVLWVLVVGFFLLWVWELGFLYKAYHALSLSKLSIQRQCTHNVAVYSPTSVQLVLHYDDTPNFWLQRLHVAITDGIIKNAHTDDFPIAFAFDDLYASANQKGIQITYTLLPFCRGVGFFGGVWLQFLGTLGLLALVYPIDETHILGQKNIRVLANIQKLNPNRLLSVAPKHTQSGIFMQHSLSAGQDFWQMRHHNSGDNMRFVDWRATARVHKLMVRQYRDEQNQQLLFLLDTSLNTRHSRHIAEQNITISHLDTMLNALLFLANTATKQGDWVGMVSFSGIQNKVIVPQKNAVAHLLNQTVDIQPSLHMPDYITAAKTALSIQKKRSLIVLLTVAHSEVWQELRQALQLLCKKHVVIVANLVEEDLQNSIHTLPSDADDARTYHSVLEHLFFVYSLQTTLRHMPNVYTLQCTPSHLAERLTKQYLALKQAKRF